MLPRQERGASTLLTYHCATCQQLFEDITEQAYEMTQQIYIMYDSLFVSGFIVMYSLMRYDDLYV